MVIGLVCSDLSGWNENLDWFACVNRKKALDFAEGIVKMWKRIEDDREAMANCWAVIDKHKSTIDSFKSEEISRHLRHID